MIATESQTIDVEESVTESQLTTSAQQRDIQHRSLPGSLQNPEPIDGGSWNRMRIHQQRRRTTTISPLATKEAKMAQRGMMSPPTTPVNKQQDCNAEVVTSIEKQRKLHRRASDDSLNTMLMSQILHRQRQQQEEQQQDGDSSRMEDPASKARRRLRAPFSRPTITSTVASSRSPLTIQVKQKEHGKDVKLPVKFAVGKSQEPEEPSSTQRRRRKYQRRNSFLVKRGNPFLTAVQHQQHGEGGGGEDRMVKSLSSLDDDELIRGLFQKVDFGAKSAGTSSSNTPTSQHSQDVGSDTSHKAKDAEKDETTDGNVKNSGGQDCWVHDTLNDISKTHCKASDQTQWGNLSWSDSDDTRWYRMISSLSSKPGEDKSGEEVPCSATSSSISTTAAAKLISERPALDRGGIRSYGGHEAGEESDLTSARRVVPQLHNPYKIPREESSGFLLTSPTPDSNQINNDSLVVPASDPLIEESPRTPRLIGYVSGRKTISSDTTTNKKASPPML